MLLIETFVETPRYTGAVYRASGWIRVGATRERGRYDTNNRYDKPKKDMWLRPSARTGSAPSTGKIKHHAPARPNRYPATWAQALAQPSQRCGYIVGCQLYAFR